MNHYVMSDIHGMGDLFDEVMNYLEEDNEPYQLIYLGDACDRGPDGYRIMKQLLRNPNVIYLKGNHEDLFVKAAYAFRRLCQDEHMTSNQIYEAYGRDVSYIMQMESDMWLHYANGGASTFESWIKDGCPQRIITRLQNLPVKYSYKNYDFCHAGCLSYYFENDDEKEMIWSRRHFPMPWIKGRTLIHGHTPVMHLFHGGREYQAIEDTPPKYLQPVRYSVNKIDMDTGAFATNLIAIYCIESDNFWIASPEEWPPLFEKYIKK